MVGGGEFLLTDIPESVLEGGGIRAVALEEFNELKKLLRRLNKSRRSRESFLDSVFASSER
jgi:hypothetical protein